MDTIFILLLHTYGYHYILFANAFLTYVFAFRNYIPFISKAVYATEKPQKALVSFLLGVERDKITIANERPVLFGNKENDLAFECDDVSYLMTENQASVSPNVPYRLLEYILADLHSTVSSECLLYGSRRVYFLYV